MSAVLDWVVGLMRTIGAPGVGVATALETVFPLCTAAGSLAWNAPLTGAGYGLGSRWHLVEGHVGRVGTVVWVVLGVALAALAVRRMRRRRQRRAVT